MLHFFKELPNIYVIFIAFGMLLVAFLITKEVRIFDLTNTVLGALIGIAMRKQAENPQQTINAENLEAANVKIDGKGG